MMTNFKDRESVQRLPRTALALSFLLLTAGLSWSLVSCNRLKTDRPIKNFGIGLININAPPPPPPTETSTSKPVPVASEEPQYFGTRPISFGGGNRTRAPATLTPTIDGARGFVRSLDGLPAAASASGRLGGRGSDSMALGKRVINGETVPEYTFRWAASITGYLAETGDEFYCGASFISNQWLLTAAHCFDETGITKVEAWTLRAGNVYNTKAQEDNAADHGNEDGSPSHNYGTSNIKSILSVLLFGEYSDDMVVDPKTKAAHKTTIRSELSEIVRHPKYTAGNLEWDIALIRLKAPISSELMTNIDLINLPKQASTAASDYDSPMPQADEVCTVVGWGCTAKDGAPSTRAQMAQLRVIEHDRCQEIFDHKAGLNQEHEFCAGFYKGNIGICSGDSGSGLACNREGKWFIAGVTSATHAVTPSSYPGVFTRVAFFRDWIDSILGRQH